MAPKNGWVGKRGAVNVGLESGHPRVCSVAFGALRGTAAFVVPVKAWRGAVRGRYVLSVSRLLFRAGSAAQGRRSRRCETISGTVRPFDEGARRVSGAKLAPFAAILLPGKLGQVTRRRAPLEAGVARPACPGMFFGDSWRVYA